jgi:hypothetical protein
VAFFGLDAFERDKTGFTSTVFVNTPLTADSLGNVFLVSACRARRRLRSARSRAVSPELLRMDRRRTCLRAYAAADVAITRTTHNSAPALSNDEQTLYVVVKAGTTNTYAYLLGLDSRTLQTIVQSPS